MNLKISKKTKRLIFVLFILLVFTGCTRITDAEGNVLAEKIIYFSGKNATTWKSMFQNESWFAAIFVWPLAQLINFFAQYMNVGIAVILVTIISRLVTISFTIKSTVMSQKMQKIQPQVNKIQAKYQGKTDEDSKLKQSQELMALYEKNDIHPMQTMLFTFISFPIMIAIWQAVQRAYTVISGSFLTLKMETKPMTAITSDLTGEGWKYIVLIVILAIVQYVSMHLPQWLAQRGMKEREKEAAKLANQQQKMMSNTMFIMIVFMSLSMPTAMSFYWIVSAAIQALQTLIIQNKYVDNK